MYSCPFWHDTYNLDMFSGHTVFLPWAPVSTLPSFSGSSTSHWYEAVSQTDIWNDIETLLKIESILYHRTCHFGTFPPTCPTALFGL